MKNIYQLLLFQLLAFILASCSNIQQKNKQPKTSKQAYNPIRCYLRADKNQRSEKGIWLEFVLSSGSNKALILLPWNTPLEGIMSDLFLIRDEDQSLISYDALTLERTQPSQSDFIILAPGETISNRVEISSSYALNQGKNYAISLQYLLVDIIDQNGKQDSLSCSTNKISINID